MKASIEVVSVKNGLASEVKITYDPSCADNGEQNGQKQSMPFPLAGKSVDVKVDDSGQITTDAGQLDPQTMSAIKDTVRPPDPSFVNKPVGVGDTWQADPQMVNEEFQVGPGDQDSSTAPIPRTTPSTAGPWRSSTSMA